MDQRMLLPNIQPNSKFLPPQELNMLAIQKRMTRGSRSTSKIEELLHKTCI